MRQLKSSRPLAVVAALVLLTATACSSGKSAAAPGASTSTPSSSSTATDSASVPTSSASSDDTASGTTDATDSSAPSASAATSTSAGYYLLPANACPLMPASVIAKISGFSDAAAQEIPTSATNPDEALLGCKYTSGSTMIGAITIDIAPADAGKSAQQYLTSDIAGSQYNFGLSKDVSGVGDAAKFGTASCAPGTCASLWLVQVHSGMVAHLTVEVAESSGAEEPVAELAKTLLTAVTTK